MIYSSHSRCEINKESLISDAVKSSNLRMLQTSTCRTFHGVNIRAVCAREETRLARLSKIPMHRCECQTRGSTSSKVGESGKNHVYRTIERALLRHTLRFSSQLLLSFRPGIGENLRWMGTGGRETRRTGRKAEAEGKFMEAHSAPVRWQEDKVDNWCRP
jgi:hypothetical protein